MSADVYRGPERLMGSGHITFTGEFGCGPLARLEIRFSPGADGVLVEVDDTGISDFQRVRGTLSPAQLAGLLAAVRAIVVLADGAGDDFDCGTYGAWIEEAIVDLPLSSGTLHRTAVRTKGFSSEELLERMHAMIHELAAQEGAEAIPWAPPPQQTRPVRRWVTVLSVVAVVVLVMIIRLQV
ncbi:Hypothetical protein A7982_11173 [Minicystis rosea]|nr:Hypothetical protein A7982_11173 [Minicystis rosea]